MSDLETPEADMMRNQSRVDAAPATLRPEESHPGLDPNNPGAAPDTTLGHQRIAGLGRPISDPVCVVRQIAHVPIRTRGTFCGSLAHADPGSEWCMVAATLGATIVATGKAGPRDIPAAEFFQGIMTIALANGEMIVEVRPVESSARRRC